MEIWNKLRKPPPDALKTIKAGRLKGKSDINPQWRYEAMTDAFGMCGEGWKFEIKESWIDEGSHDQKVQNVKILLYVKTNDAWGEPIPGIGGSMLIAKESAGLYTNDEALKMAVTDALGTAMKMLGVAADIYRGAWDGNKFNEPQKASGGKEEKKKTYKNFEFLGKMDKIKKEIGEDDYYALLGKHGYSKSNEISPENQVAALKAFEKKLQQVVEKREAKV